MISVSNIRNGIKLNLVNVKYVFIQNFEVSWYQFHILHVLNVEISMMIPVLIT